METKQSKGEVPYWNACFHPAALNRRGVPAGLREDFKKAYETCFERSAETVRLILDRAVAVWPGGVLVDLCGDRFYPASGLRDADLGPLRAGRPTLQELAEHHGEPWVRFHGLRLCLLGLARLMGNQSCEKLIGEHWAVRLKDLEIFCNFNWQDLGEIDATEVDPDDYRAYEEIGSFNDYGLEFAWREPGTFEDQPAGYYEFLFSTGGPADMLRFHGDGRIEYRYHDWFDGAGAGVGHEPAVRELARFLQECGSMPHYDGIVQW